jgi:FixJ family two-component response regulator
MNQTRNVYYFDYSPEAYNYIMTSRILRQSEKNLLKDIVEGKTVKELAIDYNCCDRTICRKRKKIFDKTKELM